jgi:hypothetical protein
MLESAPMKKVTRILALTLFALIQCFAPLVHAHVDGIQCHAQVQSSDIPLHLSIESVSQSYVESYEAQAISLPHEYQRNDAFVIPGNLHASNHPFAQDLGLNKAHSFPPLQFRAFAYNKPHPQAPPVLG